MIDNERWQELKQKETILKGAATELKVEEKDLPRVISRFKKEIEEMAEKLG